MLTGFHKLEGRQLEDRNLFHKWKVWWGFNILFSIAKNSANDYIQCERRKREVDIDESICNTLPFFQ